MYRSHIFVPGEFYHLYNRGNSKQKIFLDDDDKKRFLKLLFLANSEKDFNFKDDIVRKKIDVWDVERGKNLVSIGAWVLMPNHFHLYVTASPMSDIGRKGVTSFMRKLCTSYSKYFNIKHDRKGGLFESNFKSVHVGTDEQAKYLFSYIHLNPIKLLDPRWREEGIKNQKQALDFLDKYNWSSYGDYRDRKRIESKILNTVDFPGYFKDKEVFDKEIFDWLNYQEFNAPQLLPDVRHRADK